MEVTRTIVEPAAGCTRVDPRGRRPVGVDPAQRRRPGRPETGDREPVGLRRWPPPGASWPSSRAALPCYRTRPREPARPEPWRRCCTPTGGTDAGPSTPSTAGGVTAQGVRDRCGVGRSLAGAPGWRPGREAHSLAAGPPQAIRPGPLIPPSRTWPLRCRQPLLVPPCRHPGLHLQPGVAARVWATREPCSAASRPRGRGRGG